MIDRVLRFFLVEKFFYFFHDPVKPNPIGIIILFAITIPALAHHFVRLDFYQDFVFIFQRCRDIRFSVVALKAFLFEGSIHIEGRFFMARFLILALKRIVLLMKAPRWFP